MTKKIFKIKGMNCNSCAMLIEKELKDKVNSVKASYANENAEMEFDESKISEDEIKQAIEKLGYEAESIEENPKEEKDYEKELVAKENDAEDNPLIILKKPEVKPYNKKYGLSDKIGVIFAIISIILLLFVLYHFVLGHINIPKVSLPELGDRAGLGLLFLVGVLTGFHCISMCGGFVVSYTAKNAIKGHKSYKQHIVYGGAKLISYTIIGGIFGLIGGIIAFSVGLRAWVAILAGIFMIFYALSMLGLKFFRKFQINPKFLTKFTMSASANAKGPYKGPIVTGLLNGLFIACGPLQAMYLYAAGTGSFFSGASSLAAFGLGTLPIMIGFGTFASAISHKTTQKILKLSAIIVLVLGIIMLNRGLAMKGSQYSISALQSRITGNSIADGAAGVIKDGIQEINMDVSSSGYSPNSFVLKKGIPVKWNINVKQLTGCNQELVVNEYNIDKNLKQGLNVIEFTPDKEGTISFSCGMGMLRGSFIITETGQASQEQVNAATPPKGMQCGGGSGGGCGCGG